MINVKVALEQLRHDGWMDRQTDGKFAFMSRTVANDYLAMLHRPVLSIFGHILEVVQDCCHVRVRLWSSVDEECFIFAAILHLLHADLQLPWCGVASAVDASHSGLGIAAAEAKCGRNVGGNDS